MASSMENCEEGYDVSRFELPVKPELFCCICRDVPKDPRLCHKEHLFCLSHISKHLQSSPSCPVCIVHLTPETLRRPTGFLKHYLEDMKINCNYNARGCPDFVRLENLQSHVDQCGFAPMICTNEECGIEINRKDQDIHERNDCQFSIAKCHDCSDIKESQEQSKTRLDEVKVKLNETKIHIAEIETKQDQINDKINPMKITVEGMKQVQNEIRENQNEIKRQQDQINEKVDQVTENVDKMKQTQAEMKAEMRQQLEKMTDMMNQILQGTYSNNEAQATCVEPPSSVYSTINHDIIILGGRYGPKRNKVLNTVEVFNVEETTVQLPPMELPRSASASCIYNNDVIVAGGYDGREGTDTIEVLKMNKHPLQWTFFYGRLPAKLSAHAIVIYRGTLIVVGGYNWYENKISDGIYEMHLTPPYTSKLLVRMPQPRRHHRAELVNEKLYILGGSTTGYSKNVLDSVLVYDFGTNECKTCASLPRAVWKMSTVTWGNMIIVVGGLNKDDNALNDVIMFDTKTRRSEWLPSMLFKRRGCTAVIVDDVIIVFGGGNENQEYLKSVESLTIGTNVWIELSGMKEKKRSATAVVKPHN